MNNDKQMVRAYLREYGDKYFHKDVCERNTAAAWGK
jgi:hypothetical protein